MVDIPRFHTKAGFQLPGVSEQKLLEARECLKQTYGLNLFQIAEAASYSLAMVVRFALGLSAAGGKVCVIANDSLAGQVALACVRHLCNAGGSAAVVPFCALSNASVEFKAQLHALEQMQVRIEPPQSISAINDLMASSHNVIFALYGGSVLAPFQMDELINTLNEARTPIHCLEVPYGLNPDTGAIDDEPLFASSTLSLGSPLKGLYNGSDYAGRHYLCDISLTRPLYESMGEDITSIFSEQPVVQIFPAKAADGE